MKAREATALANKVLSDPGDGADGHECVLCSQPFSVKFGLEPTALCNPCAQDAAQSLAVEVLRRKRVIEGLSKRLAHAAPRSHGKGK